MLAPNGAGGRKGSSDRRPRTADRGPPTVKSAVKTNILNKPHKHQHQ